jgi:hypothetical protein
VGWAKGPSWSFGDILQGNILTVCLPPPRQVEEVEETQGSVRGPGSAAQASQLVKMPVFEVSLSDPNTVRNKDYSWPCRTESHAL